MMNAIKVNSPTSTLKVKSTGYVVVLAIDTSQSLDFVSVLHQRKSIYREHLREILDNSKLFWKKVKCMNPCHIYSERYVQQ